MTPFRAFRPNLVALLLVLFALTAAPVQAQAVLSQYLDDVPAGTLVPGADAFGPIRDDIAAAPVLQGGEVIGWAFVTSDFVGTTGYSGKPIHTMVALDPAARVIGLQLVKHSEPIVLIGIPESEIAP
jgi:NosR/NirI family transcriptional regulator, nitrous oxide reductase regulator